MPKTLVWALALSLLTLPLTAQKEILKPAGTDLGIPFSPGVLAGDLLYLAGAIGNQPGKIVVVGDAEAQTRQALRNLGTVLAEAGLDFSRVVAANVYLADIRDAATVNAVLAEVTPAARPARTTVEADIAIPGALVEISMLAARSEVDVDRLSPAPWPEPPGHFSWAVRVGSTVLTAGMVGAHPGSGNPEGDVGEQTARALANVGAALEAAGMGHRNVTSCNVYLKDSRDFRQMNAAYAKVFHQAPPARATVRARAIAPGALVEIACTAERGERRIVRPRGQAPSSSPLSPAIQVGDRLYLSGMVGRQDGGYPAGPAAQTRVILDRLKATLEAAGMGFQDVVNATVFLSDIRSYQAMNEVYAEVVDAPPPARATVGTQLMGPDALVEIQMQAWRLKGEEQPARRPVSTYSIVARDPATGDFGVAVQSHWFQVGTVVAWAKAGVGAVATQSFVETSYGPKGLELITAGKSAREALDQLLAADPQRDVRQVAMVDAQGRVATWTGPSCIEAAGHAQGKGYSVQANLMDRAEVWPAMSRAFETSKGDLAERMLAALEAAEAAGGDIRGRQSAALLVVPARASGKPWEDRSIDLRVADHPMPLAELRRLLGLHRAYEQMNAGDEAMAKNEIERANRLYSAAAALAPEIVELPFWQAVTLFSAGQEEQALPIFQKIFAQDMNWHRLIPRLVKAGLLPDDPAGIAKILALGQGS